jgi:2-polyprenyl-3-methyl-5-hydroxy-6-metoxy-1,4-benzoquinol methylase
MGAEGVSVVAQRVPQAARTAEPGPSDIHAHLTRPVIVQLDSFGARTVLDLGCGRGWFTEALVRCGFEATGADADAEHIAIASGAYPEVAFRCIDITQPLPADWRGRFDAVVAIELLDHVNQPRLALQQAIAALRPGGLLVSTVPFHGYVKNLGLALSDRLDLRWQALQEKGRLRFYSRHTLMALMAGSGLQELHFETIGRLPPIARSMLVAGKAPQQGPETT